MSAVKNHYWDEIEAKKLFANDNISEDEAFEILDANGVDEITWNERLNSHFATWQFLNLK